MKNRSIVFAFLLLNFVLVLASCGNVAKQSYVSENAMVTADVSVGVAQDCGKANAHFSAEVHVKQSDCPFKLADSFVWVQNGCSYTLQSADPNGQNIEAGWPDAQNTSFEVIDDSDVNPVLYKCVSHPGLDHYTCVDSDQAKEPCQLYFEINHLL